MATDSVDLDAITSRQQFAEALTAVRATAGLTVRQVARASGIHPSTVGGYYSGRHLPPLRPEGGIRTLLRACGVTDPDDLEAWQRTLARIRRAPGPRPGALPPPFVGLRPYGPTDAPLFHGREDQIRALLGRVAAPEGGITVLVGEAGSGKTSVLRAGLVPRLGVGPHGPHVAIVKPGPRPLSALADALAGAVGPTVGRSEEILTLIEGSPGAVRDLVARARRRVVLVVDPLDDLFTRRPDPADPFPHPQDRNLDRELDRALDREEENVAFVNALAAVARSGPGGEPPPASVVVALGSGFLTQATRYPELLASLSDLADPPDVAPHAIVVPALVGDALREVIRIGAVAGDLDVEPGLVEQVVNDAAPGGTAVLPRVSHALNRTWEAGGRRRLTLDDYAAIGGLRGGLSRAAETAYDGLDEVGRNACRTLLARLVAVTPGGARVADPITVDRSEPGLDAAVRALADAGLLVVSDDDVSVPTGCLPDLWPRLRDWLTAPPGPTPPAPVGQAPSATQAAPGDGAQGGIGSDGVGPGGAAGTWHWWAWRWMFAAAALSVLFTVGLVHELWR